MIEHKKRMQEMNEKEMQLKLKKQQIEKELTQSFNLKLQTIAAQKTQNGVRNDQERETFKSCQPLELDDKNKEKESMNSQEKDRLFGVYREYY